jgi:SAM-dependent methyltransferase
MSMPRRVLPELLDGLAGEDPRAQRSRNDLRRVHRAMGTLSIVLGALDRSSSGSAPRDLLELGAGDGSLLLRIAQQRASRWPNVQVTFLDRLNLVTPDTLHQLRKLGWTARVVTMDVFDWLARPDDARWDVVLANLFAHHFPAAELERLLAGIATRARAFVCCEPRRATLSLVGSHLVGLLGAGHVTRQDAVSSVHAGFQAQELTGKWPGRENWLLDEYRAGPFSHCFIAMRKER